MIREIIARITTRISDTVLHGKNKAMIVLGTDRKNTIDSGYGDGGRNDVNSAVIDMVVGYPNDARDPNFARDKSRIYIAEKTDPDENFGISLGSAVTGEPAIVQISDHIYLKARKKIKILNGNISINIDDSGNLEIVASETAQITVGSAKLILNKNGSIELNGSQGINGMIVTHLDRPVHIDPITGAPIQASFETPPGIPVVNRKVTIK